MKIFAGVKKWLILTFVAPFIIFLPSLFVFFTNDDFFFLKISNVKTIGGFFNFFSLIKGPDGFGMYRPLTTQVFYWLDLRFFNLNPFGLHIISFIFFFGIIYLVYKFIRELFKNEKIAVISAFLYAVSATHFAHLYYLATFQELGMTFFVLLSCLVFLRKKYLLSFIFFIPGLLSKETAVITPLLLAIIYWYEGIRGSKALNIKRLLIILAPFAICLLTYLFIRFAGYGFASGNTYIWDFTLTKLINTLGWYLLWAFNLPETLLDFVGPGLKINPNLFIYWSKQFIPIFVLFTIQLLVLVYVLFKAVLSKAKEFRKESAITAIFCGLWFFIALLPVIFLPEHKFPFYLTLPLIGITTRISYLFEKLKIKGFVLVFFVIIWTILSVLTVKHTVNTHWVTNGEKISKGVYDYFNKNISKSENRTIVFTDTADDKTLPWSPTDVVQVALSNNNFFDVYFKSISGSVLFDKTGKTVGKNSLVVNSRIFLGY